jgi:hypothetical protein
MTTLLTESAVAPTKTKSGNWRAVLITPGKGSSGLYTESMLKADGPIAFPKGTHSYIDHPIREGEVRSPKNLMGVLAEDAYYEEGIGLVAELQVMPHWKEFVEAVAPHTGLSIYATGEGEYNENGELVVESLLPHTQNSVDLVSYAGRPGSKLVDKLYEAAIAMIKEAEPGELAEKDLVKWEYQGETAYGQVSYVMTSGVFPFEGDPLQIEATEENPVALMRVWTMTDGEWTPTEMLMGAPISALTKISELGESERGINGNALLAEATSPMEDEGNPNMDEIKAMIEALSAQVAEIASALKSDEETPVETEEVDVASVAEAMVAANLPEVSRKAVYESLRNGADINEAIEAQRAFVESVVSHLKETADAVPSTTAEEAVVVPTVEKASSLRDILNIKVG